MAGSRHTTDKHRARAKILIKLEAGYSPKRAAKAGGIHRRTLERWRKEDEEFDKECADAIEGGTDEIEDVALEQAKKGNGIVTMFLLNGRRPEKYKRKTEVEVAKPIQIQLIKGDEQL